MNTQKKISVYIVEDYLLIRKSLIHMLKKAEEFDILGDFDNAEDCIEVLEEHPSDVVIMDLGLPGINGLEATQIIKKKNPETKVIILTSHEKRDEVLAALASGASAYCLKDIDTLLIQNIIKDVHKGAVWLHPHIADVANVFAPKPNSTDFDNLYTNIDFGLNLTEREMDVLKLVVDGKTNTEIADKMSISIHTAKAHVGSILSKLSVSDRVQAAVKAVRSKIIN